jgi:c-di-GMP-binding flagellar brake protein YcgR
VELSTRNYHEKRSFIRMKLDCPAQVTCINDDFSGVCSNLSGGGMLLVLEKPVEVGNECVVRISSHFGHGPMLKARAKVNRAISYQGKCHAGLSIIELLDQH